MKKKLVSLFALMFITTLGAHADIDINETNFPDRKFRKFLLAQTYGADGKLTPEEIDGVTSMKVQFMEIQSLKGIEHFTALTSLKCSFNLLKTLDLTQNTALEELLCDNNLLTALDLTKNTALTRLFCYENNILSIDLSQNTELETLSCSENQLRTLDLSKNTVLSWVNCSNNLLTALDLSQNAALEELNISLNQIKGETMDALVASLPAVSKGKLYAIYNKQDQNEITTTQVTAANANGWTIYTYDGNDWKVYADPTAVQNVKATANDTSASKKKYFKDGKIVIEANGKEFDAAGAQVK